MVHLLDQTTGTMLEKDNQAEATGLADLEGSFLLRWLVSCSPRLRKPPIRCLSIDDVQGNVSGKFSCRFVASWSEDHCILLLNEVAFRPCGHQRRMD